MIGKKICYFSFLNKANKVIKKKYKNHCSTNHFIILRSFILLGKQLNNF